MTPPPTTHQGAEPREDGVTVWYGDMPESNGKSNWTAMLIRKGGDAFASFADGIIVERSEYPERVRYEADRLRWLLGETSERPNLLKYDADKHSGYVSPAPAAPTNGGGEPVAWTYERAHKFLSNHIVGTSLFPHVTIPTEALRTVLKGQPQPTQQGGAERGGLTEAENRRVQAALYMVGNPSAWDDYDEGASETIRDLCALIERLAALKTEKA